MHCLSFHSRLKHPFREEKTTQQIQLNSNASTCHTGILCDVNMYEEYCQITVYGM